MSKHVSQSKLRGFSLTEVLVALFVFSVVMVGVTSYFTSITLANQNTKRLQQNLEDVRFAMNRIAKVLRTSVVISPSSVGSGSQIRVFDYSQGRCLQYRYASNEILEFISTDIPPTNGTEKSWCANTASFSQGALVSVASGALIAGNFYVVPSGNTLGSERAGRVVMDAVITRGNHSSTLQTTVSLRNYKETYP